MKLPILITILLTLASTALSDKVYIVTFKSDTPVSVIDQAIQTIESKGATLKMRYHTLHGFAANVPEGLVASLSEFEGVAYVEEDQIMTTQAADADAGGDGSAGIRVEL